MSEYWDEERRYLVVKELYDLFEKIGARTTNRKNGIRRVLDGGGTSNAKK